MKHKFFISSGAYDQAGKKLAEFLEPTSDKANEAVAYFKKKKAELDAENTAKYFEKRMTMEKVRATLKRAVANN